MLRLDRLAFLNALEATRPGVTNQEQTEQSNCFLFHNKRVWTFNDEVACSMPFDLQFNGAIPAHKLTALLARLPDDTILIEADEYGLRIKGRKRRGSVAVQSKITMPLAELEPPDNWRLLPQEFIPAIDMVRGSVSTNDSEFALTCVHVCATHVEAADNTQISRHTLSGLDVQDALIRGESLKSVVLVDATHVSETDNWIHFKNDSGLVIACRRYVDEYPPADQLFEGIGEPFIFPPSVEEAVERCELFSQENLDANQVTVTLKSGKLILRGEGPDGWFEELREMPYDGRPMRFGIAPKILKEICGRNKQCELLPGRLRIQFDSFTYVGCLYMV